MNQHRPLAPTTGLQALAQRHPIAFFLTMALGFVYLLMPLPIMAQYGIIPGAGLPAMLGMDMEKLASLRIIVPGPFSPRPLAPLWKAGCALFRCFSAESSDGASDSSGVFSR